MKQFCCNIWEDKIAVSEKTACRKRGKLNIGFKLSASKWNHWSVMLTHQTLVLVQVARYPPSTGSVTPLIILALSLSKNKIAFTTSPTSAVKLIQFQKKFLS